MRRFPSGIWSRTAFTSRLVITSGSRWGFLARTTPSIHGTSTFRTSRKRKRRAARAWFCVAAETPPSTARWDRKVLISPAPMSLGWRLSWKRMKRRAQAT